MANKSDTFKGLCFPLRTNWLVTHLFGVPIFESFNLLKRFVHGQNIEAFQGHFKTPIDASLRITRLCDALFTVRTRCFINP